MLIVASTARRDGIQFRAFHLQLSADVLESLDLLGAVVSIGSESVEPYEGTIFLLLAALTIRLDEINRLPILLVAVSIGSADSLTADTPTRRDTIDRQ